MTEIELLGQVVEGLQVLVLVTQGVLVGVSVLGAFELWRMVRMLMTREDE